MTFLDRLYEANSANLNDYQPLFYADRLVGLLWRAQAALLIGHGVPLQPYRGGFQLDPSLNCTALSTSLAKAVIQLEKKGHVPGWRGELYPLTEDHHSAPVALIERAAMPLFGGCGYGVHVNGLTSRNGQDHIWIARRAWNKPTEPGKLDQIAAGGMPFGIGAFDNMQKESAEEAGIPSALSAQARSVSTTSYFYQVENGIRADVLFNFDLWLPTDFTPHNTDGEVAEFMCLPIQEVMHIVKTGDEFKFNASVVLIDLFVRHGYLTPEHRDYEQICAMLNPRRTRLQQIRRGI